MLFVTVANLHPRNGDFLLRPQNTARWSELKRARAGTLSAPDRRGLAAEFGAGAAEVVGSQAFDTDGLAGLLDGGAD